MSSLRTTRNSLNRSYVDKSLLSGCTITEPNIEKSVEIMSSPINGDKNDLSYKLNSGSAGSEEETSPKKRKKDKVYEPPKIIGNVDIFCWRCHKPGECVTCSSCSRVYHLKCTQLDTKPTGFWPCIECDTVQRVEAVSNRSLNVGVLSELLSYALERMKSYPGSEHFSVPVDTTIYENYKDYILKPMDLSQLDKNIKSLQYGSTESFISDAKWMVHNSYIYNSAQSSLTIIARGILKIGKQECEEIDNCQYCYRHAHTLPNERWFIEPCEKPHLLIWARLKGFPYWPAKVMRVTGSGVDVRFFGDHNRSIVSPATCLLFSKKKPFRPRDIKGPGIERALEEIETHILKLESKFKCFRFGEFRTEFNPRLIDQYIVQMLPKCEASRILVNNGNREKEEETILREPRNSFNKNDEKTITSDKTFVITTNKNDFNISSSVTVNSDMISLKNSKQQLQDKLFDLKKEKISELKNSQSKITLIPQNVTASSVSQALVNSEITKIICTTPTTSSQSNKSDKIMKDDEKGNLSLKRSINLSDISGSETSVAKKK